MMLAQVKLHRSGVTLIEVLVAIFVASIGLLALLALFPVGALSMKQALRDSRCTQLCTNAIAQFKLREMGKDISVIADLSVVPSIADSFAGAINAASLGTRDAIVGNGPSYPVYVDPLGVLRSSNHIPVYQDVVGPGVPVASKYPRIPRHTVSFLNSPEPAITQYLRSFCLLDDIYFEPQGTNAGAPQLPSGSSVYQRDPRYTFALMLRRPVATVATTLEVTVVIYAGRPLLTVGVPSEETAYAGITFDPKLTTVAIPYDQLGMSRPTIKPGGWILDATMLSDLGAPEPHGYFYRVIDVIDEIDPINSTPSVTKNQVTLELQSRPRQATSTGHLIVMDNVVEVFEKGTFSTQ